MSTYDDVRPVGQRPTPTPPAARPERRWSARDVADYLGIALSTVYQWRCSGYGRQTWVSASCFARRACGYSR